MLRFPTTFAWRATQRRSSRAAGSSWIGGGQRNAVPDPERPALGAWLTESPRAGTRPSVRRSVQWPRSQPDTTRHELGITIQVRRPSRRLRAARIRRWAGVAPRDRRQRSRPVERGPSGRGGGESRVRRAQRRGRDGAGGGQGWTPARIGGRPAFHRGSDRLEAGRLARARGVRPTGFESALPAPRTLFATESVAKSVRTVLRRLGQPATNAPLGHKPGGAVVSGGCVSGGAWQACGGCPRRVRGRSKAHDPELGRGLPREGRFCSRRLRSRAALRTPERGVRGKADAGRHSG